MGTNFGFPEKMDAIDLIITALKDHEKRLDSISKRLENLVSRMAVDKIGIVKKEEETIPTPAVKKVLLVICHRWDEFKHKSEGAKTVTFEIEPNFFNVYSMVNGDVFRYSECLPNKNLKITEEQTSFHIIKDSLSNIDSLQFLIDRKLKCGLNASIKTSRTVLSEKQCLFEFSYVFDPEYVKEHLSEELGISKNDIIEGKIT